MHRAIVIIHKLGQCAEILLRVVQRHVLVSQVFEGAIEAFGHGRFGFSFGGIMLHPFSLQQILDLGVVELFAFIRLQLFGFASRALEDVPKRVSGCATLFGLEPHYPRKLTEHVYHNEPLNLTACLLI